MRNSLTLLLLGIAFLSCAQMPEQLSVKTSDSETTIFAGDKPVLSYVHTETPAPEGTNPLFKRSAYIHPLWPPGG